MPGPGAFHRLLHRPVDPEGVVAVDDVTRHPIPFCPLEDVTGDLCRARYGNRITVVLDDEDHRELVDAGPVHRLVPVALGRRPFTPVHNDDRVASIDLETVGDTNSMRILGADRRGLREDPPVLGRPVVGELTSARHRIGLPGEYGEKHIEWRDPPRKGDAHVAVIGEDPVPLRIERADRRHLDRLMARGADDERRPPLAVESEHPIIHLPGHQHRSIQGDDVVIGEAEIAVMEFSLRPLHRWFPSLAT